MKKLRTKKLSLEHTTVRVLDEPALEQVGGAGQLAHSVKAVCCSLMRSGCGGSAF
jgi:hypothetical protein